MRKENHEETQDRKADGGPAVTLKDKDHFGGGPAHQPSGISASVACFDQSRVWLSQR